MRRIGLGLVALVIVAVIAGCASAVPTLPSPEPLDADAAVGPRHPFVDAGQGGVTVNDGDDWTLPESAAPAENSGYFSEETDIDELVLVHSVDVTWRQLAPSRSGPLDREGAGSAQGMYLASLDAQLAEPGDFWMRLFASGTDWAPEWVAEDCDVTGYGPDDDGQEHLPLWDDCVWGHLLDTYRSLFVDLELAADPRLRFVYVPGAFDWAEFDYDIVSDAAATGDLDQQEYLDWYAHAWTDLVELFGENAHKLVFTGEDHPWGPFGAADDLLAADAVDAGLGIRNGITELSNFHLSETPAFASTVRSDGHLQVDESAPLHDGERIVATENECFDDCGYAVQDAYYAIRQANLKALQLRVNWMYVVPEDSGMAAHSEHWDWVRLSLGQTAETSVDAWAALRDAEDTYWVDEEFPRAWDTQPWVRNLERWLVQVDEAGSVAHRTAVDTHTGEVAAENGVSHEGLSTDVAAGDTGFAFDIDEAFAASTTGRTILKITFLDTGAGSFRVESADGDSAPVDRAGSGTWRTATVALPDGAVAADATRLRIALDADADDLVVRFVRLVRIES